MDTILFDISQSLEDPNIRASLIQSIHESGSAKQVHDFYSKIYEEKRAAPAISFELVAQKIRKRVDANSYELHGDAGQRRMGFEIRDEIITTIQADILSRVNKDVCWDTKFNALNVLADIVVALMGMENGSELSDPMQHGAVPETIVSGMITVGKMLSDVEIDQVVAEKGLPVKVNQVREFKNEWSGAEPFKGLEQFLDIFIDGSLHLEFHECLAAVDAELAGGPAPEGPTSRLKAVQSPRTYTVPQQNIESIITNRISSKLNRRSCFETKLNAFQVLANIGLSFLEAREGPHREILEDGKLDTLLTDTMMKICNFTTEDSLNFLVNENFKDDIFTLGMSRKGTLPGMGSVLRHLDIPDDYMDSDID
jgi:hypothetical protein